MRPTKTSANPAPNRASLEEAYLTWHRLAPTLRETVVALTYKRILDALGADGKAPLQKVLETLFADRELMAAHTALKSQFINRPLYDSRGEVAMKLSCSRISRKSTSEKTSSFADGQVWFEIPQQIAADSFETAANVDVSQHFTETRATNLSKEESIANAISDSLRSAEIDLHAKGQCKVDINLGTGFFRHGTLDDDYEPDSKGQDRRLQGDGNRRQSPNKTERIDAASNDATSNDLVERVVALDTLLRWAQNPDINATRLYALLGDSGTGKTSHGQKFARVLNGESDHELWPKKIDANAANNLPKALFIDLAELAPVNNLAQLSLEEMLVLILKRRDGVRVQTVADVAPLINEARAGQLIFVFDGLDELLRNDTLVLQKVFEQFLRVVERQPKGSQKAKGNHPPKMIVSCRSHYFRDIESQHSFFTARGRHTVSADDYRCLTLLPWETKQIEGFLTRRTSATEAARLMDLIRNTYNLEELASRPVLLSMMVGNIQALLAEREKGTPIVAATLYSQTVARWIERDDGKHRLNKAQKPLLMGALASAMWNDNAEAWPADRLDQWLVQTVGALLPGHYGSAELRGIQDDLRTATFIVRPEQQQFNFAHRSYGEYFLARFLIDALTQIADGFWSLETARAYLPNRMLNLETIGFLTELWVAELAHQRPAAMVLRMKALVKLLQHDAGDLAAAPAPLLHAVLWQLYLIANTTGVTNGVSPARESALHSDPINLRGLSFADARWENLDLTNAPPLDLRGASLRGLYAVNCRFGAIYCDQATLWSQSVLRDCVTTAIKWGDSLRTGMQVRSGSQKTTNGPFVGPWAAPMRFTAQNAVAFNHDGTRIASAGDDGSVRLWDALQQREIAVLKGHTGSVRSVAFNHDGTRIVSAGSDGSVRLWDAQQLREIAMLKGHSDQVKSVAFNHDGTRIVGAGDDGSVRLWDTLQQREIAVLKGHTGRVRSVAFNYDCTRIVSAGNDGTVRHWDTLQQCEIAVFKGHTGWVLGVAFNHDGTRIVSGGNDNTVRLWDTLQQREIAVLRGHTGSVRSVAFNHDGTRIASAGNGGSVRLWDTLQQRELAVLKGHTDWVRSVAFNHDGTRIASAGDDGSVRLWDTLQQREIAVLKGHTSLVFSVAFNHDGTRIVIAGGAGSVRLWDTLQQREIAVLKGHTGWVSSVAFNHDGTRIVSAGDDGTVRIWDTLQQREIIVLKGHTDWVRSVAFNHNGTRIVSAGNDGSVRLWDTRQQREIAVLKGHTHSAFSVVFNHDGTRIVSAGSDGTVRLWDTLQQREIAVLKGYTHSVLSVAFNYDGTRIVSAGIDGSVRLWDALQQLEIAVLKGHTGSVLSVAFNHDGTRMVSAGDDGTVRIWDTLQQREIAVLKEHTSLVFSVAFNHDGTRIVSAGNDGTVRLWRIDAPSKLISMTLVVANPLPPFSPSWAEFNATGDLLAWSENAPDHWLFRQRNGLSEPIEAAM